MHQMAQEGALWPNINDKTLGPHWHKGTCVVVRTLSISMKFTIGTQ